MSAPPQNTFPSPESTTARMLGSPPTRVNSSVRAAMSSALKALRTSGRLSRTSATAPLVERCRTGWTMASLGFEFASGLASQALLNEDDGPGQTRVPPFRRHARDALALFHRVSRADQQRAANLQCSAFSGRLRQN